VAPTIIASPVIAANSLLGSGFCVQSSEWREQHERTNNEARTRPRLDFPQR